MACLILLFDETENLIPLVCRLRDIFDTFYLLILPAMACAFGPILCTLNGDDKNQRIFQYFDFGGECQ